MIHAKVQAIVNDDANHLDDDMGHLHDDLDRIDDKKMLAGGSWTDLGPWSSPWAGWGQ